MFYQKGHYFIFISGADPGFQVRETGNKFYGLYFIKAHVKVTLFGNKVNVQILGIVSGSSNQILKSIKILGNEDRLRQKGA
jgi:hypothetical protein